MLEKLAELKRLNQEAIDLQYAKAVLVWDEQTYLPAGGSAARGRQLAILAGLVQEKFTDPTIGHLLDALEPYAQSLPYDNDDAAMIRATRRRYDLQTKIPPAFAAEYAEYQSGMFQAWVEARPANDFKKVQPFLEKNLEYSRQLANFFPGYEHIADPLINMNDYGMKAADVRRVFGELRAQLVPLIQKIHAQPQVEDDFLHQHFPKADQIKFSEAVARDFGYDFNRGRLDMAAHPFTISFSGSDVRITTRVNEQDLGDCLFSVFHETGHALYELGGNPAYEATALQGGVSSGVHESQSRTWENIVGRSRGFWQFYYPKLQECFPQQLGSVDLASFYRAINLVQPSLIRTDADEVTYNLHPMLRFDLELELLEGKLAIQDLPEAWNARYRSDLGIVPEQDGNGVLQDIHWYSGPIGGSFQGYTLGNILSAMFYEKALQAHPDIPAQMAQGRFDTLHSWLIENIYQYGSKYTPTELIQRVTGGGLDVQPLIRYLSTKYGEIYGL